jgi:hypothetical protein
VCVCLCAFLFLTTGYEDRHANKRTTARRQGRSMHHPEDLINAMHTPSLPRIHVEKNKKEFNKTLYDRSFVGGLEIASG